MHNLIEKEIKKRNDGYAKIEEAFYRNFIIESKSSIRKHIVQNTIMDDLHIEWSPVVCGKINIVMKQLGIKTKNCNGLRSFVGLKLRLSLHNNEDSPIYGASKNGEI